MTWGIVLACLTLVLVIATALSFLRVAHGFVRVFSFPRLQVLLATLVLLGFSILMPADGWISPLASACLVAVAIAQIVPIAQFTPLKKAQSQDFEGPDDDPSVVSILSFNVKQSNRHYDKALAVAAAADADIALFMEVDSGWAKGLEPLADRYEHVVSHPLDNSYGMILYSRLPLSDVAVRELVMDDIPSITATVILRNDDRFRLYCVHPEPPVPVVDSYGRDAELVTVAGLVREDTLPCIVTGDLNDVAWSHTTRLFQRISRLLDPRVGRGFYSTFDARFFFIRWPLDHLFHDARFRLAGIRRLDRAGSDHFPILFRLALGKVEMAGERPEQMDEADRQEARELRREGVKLERDPVGTDWES